ncbi:hypothetical protein ONS95_012840 [Cadophora gregata]|uniref:uncharacterized protein n=1 Tax=Cadophora gregata TaxID=51156 RepID=UPI0026DB1369|nr:uncharacterized protein ONS95_012840 [Cadophora gregata]KAK0115788.1 hypothetical protein ONS95_012840 [Cadophora gregata]
MSPSSLVSFSNFNSTSTISLSTATMKPQASMGKMMRAPSWDLSSAGGSAEDHSADKSAEWQGKTEPEPYQSCLAEIDRMITEGLSKSAANKVRHGGAYRAVRRVSIAQGKGEAVDVKWLQNEEINLWYTYSDDPFPGVIFSFVDIGSGLDNVSNQSATTEKISPASDIVDPNDEFRLGYRRCDVDVEWDVSKTAYIQPMVDQLSTSDTSPKSDIKSSSSSTAESKKEDIIDDKKNGQARHHEDISTVINGELANATKRVTFNKSKPMSLGTFLHEEDSVHKTAARPEGPANRRRETKKHNSVRYADMRSGLLPYIKSSKSSQYQLSNAYDSHVTIKKSANTDDLPGKSRQQKSQDVAKASYGQLDGIDEGKYVVGHGRVFSSSISEEAHTAQSRRRGSRRASILQPPPQGTGWIEFRDPEPFHTSPPATNIPWTLTKMTNIEQDAKKAAALKAWANFPAQAVEEDREAAAAYVTPTTLGLVTNTMAATPVIKETYKQVVVSDTFERKIVGKSVNIFE